MNKTVIIVAICMAVCLLVALGIGAAMVLTGHPAEGMDVLRGVGAIAGGLICFAGFFCFLRFS